MEPRAMSKAPSDTARPSAEEMIWDAVAAAYARWKFIAGVTGVIAILSVIVALLIPRWYAAEARVLQPEGGGLSLLGMVAGAAGGLGNLLGGASGEYTRYLAILSSRTMMENTVEEFDLVRVYELEDSETPVVDAIDVLAQNVEFEVDPEFLFLIVRAFDREPERAAAMANFLVGALNEEHARLASQNARQTRLFVEGRLNEAQSDLDSVRVAMQAFQEQNGLVELESQAQAFMESVAAQRGNVAQLEVRYQTLARQYGPDNPQVQAARDALQAARGQISGALSGGDALLPVSMQELPSLSRQYAELMQGMLVQAQVIETIYPIYEQSLFQERNAAMAVQVVDDAVAPTLAARPQRRIIVIVATFTAFLLALGYVLALTWWQRHAGALVQRLHRAAEEHRATA